MLKCSNNINYVSRPFAVRFGQLQIQKKFHNTTRIISRHSGIQFFGQSLGLDSQRAPPLRPLSLCIRASDRAITASIAARPLSQVVPVSAISAKKSFICSENVVTSRGFDKTAPIIEMCSRIVSSSSCLGITNRFEIMASVLCSSKRVARQTGQELLPSNHLARHSEPMTWLHASFIGDSAFSTASGSGLSYSSLQIWQL